ncbi:MAG: tRNA uridine-5-carboxymethylaminomethyl(34) synthesis GTPase MnmE [Gammaproteobacteria bacterium]|nr:tRNA uridine-5-carboxymethylaminomethyl(34) synthesis GTPase MnmE [Gammaproteobacteria bacterium]
MHTDSDTIAAIATPPGKGGIGIIRVSGPQTPKICQSLFAETLKPRVASLQPFYDEDGALLDRGIALFFSAPHSYTGEHVLELQAHGGPVLLEILLQHILKLGARLAKPGEFTERAFLNEKIDLTQAEAVADLIESSSAQAMRAAARSLDGLFSRTVQQLQQQLIALRTYIEAALDFPEEEIDFLSDDELTQRMLSVQQQVTEINKTLRSGQLLKEGMSVVILGSPNAGKSSLLNRLSGRDTAIVTEIAGTTRDVLREHIHIDGMPLHIIDTAGLRESVDLIEQEGVRRAWQEVDKADHVLLVIDDSKGITDADQKIIDTVPGNKRLDIIHNKIDLSGRSAKVSRKENTTHIWLSLKTGEGIDALVEFLEKSVGYEQTGENAVLARKRHITALQRVKQNIDNAAQQLSNRAGELAAEELRLAQLALSELTGEHSSEDLLSEIFSSFCIGK